jgi:sporulation protein YtfJ
MAASEATEILDALMRNMREIISTKTIIGEPIQSNGTTILPVMKVTLGFAAGAGSGKSEKPGQNTTAMGGSGGGGGGGVSISPVGFLVVDADRAMLITPKSSKWEWVAESLPEILEKLGKLGKDFRAKKTDDTPKEETPSGA